MENTVGSHREILASKNGVVLEQVTLYDGNVPIDSRFVVKSQRTPEIPSFGSIIEAQHHFDEEVQRSARNGIRPV